MRRRFARALQFENAFVGAVATLDVPAAIAIVFAIATRQAGGVPNTVGSISFAAGATTGTFTAGFSPTVAIAAGGASQ